MGKGESIRVIRVIRGERFGSDKRDDELRRIHHRDTEVTERTN